MFDWVMISLATNYFYILILGSSSRAGVDGSGHPAEKFDQQPAAELPDTTGSDVHPSYPPHAEHSHHSAGDHGSRRGSEDPEGSGAHAMVKNHSEGPESNESTEERREFHDHRDFTEQPDLTEEPQRQFHAKVE